MVDPAGMETAWLTVPFIATPFDTVASLAEPLLAVLVVVPS
jgi:hypothetical protein